MDTELMWRLLLNKLAPEYRDDELDIIKSRLDEDPTLNIWLEKATFAEIDRWLGIGVAK